MWAGDSEEEEEEGAAEEVRKGSSHARRYAQRERD
jgi:hypothetical protein